MFDEKLEKINIFYLNPRKNSEKTLYCCYCSKQIAKDEPFFINPYGFTFCNKECFYKAKQTRSSIFYTAQKNTEKYAPRSKNENDKYRHIWGKK
jgi:hypothetical protein